MKLNKKGFTLTELLAVIVVLAIIITIATQVALNVIARAKEKTSEEMEESLADAAVTYYIDCVKNNGSNCSTVTVEKLKDGFFQDDKNICNKTATITINDTDDITAVVPKGTCKQ